MATELIELSSVIGDIYDAAVEPVLWQQALASVCNYVGGYAAVLFWHDADIQNAEALHLYNDDPAYTRLYFEKYLPMDPFFPASSFIEAGVVRRSNEIVPQPELEQTRFYQEWIKPQGIVDAIAVNLEKGVTRSSFIVIRTNSTYGEADEPMCSRLAALVPHLQRAVEIGRLFDQGNAKEAVLTQTLDRVEAAVLLVRADGAITFANAPAKAMLDAAVLVRTEDSVLRAALPEADRILHATFMTAERGDESVGVRGVAVPLTANSKDRWFAHVLPLTSGNRQKAAAAHTAVAAIFVRKTVPDAPAPLEAIARQHKLTASEVRVLDALLKVHGVKEMAGTLGLSPATVKTHLHNLFRKTGTRRQSELIKLVAGI